MKLNTGDKCKVLEKGLKDTIRENIDYWYKIEFNSQQGWVFGSQSSIKTGQKIVPETFNEAMKRLIKAVDEEDMQSLNSFVHPGYGVFSLECPGAFEYYTNQTSLDVLWNSESSGLKFHMNNLSREYSKQKPKEYEAVSSIFCCSGHPGLYILKGKITHHPVSGNAEAYFKIFNETPTDEEIKANQKDVQVKKSIEDKITRQIIIAENELSDSGCGSEYYVFTILYFLYENGKWYLVIFAPVSHCCFGA